MATRQVTPEECEVAAFEALQSALDGRESPLRDALMRDAQRPEMGVGPDVRSGEFKEWFGASRVLDAAGEPLRLYHGSRSSEMIDSFDIPAFFTDSLDGARWYVDSGDNGRVYAVYLSIEHPLDLRPVGAFARLIDIAVASGVQIEGSVADGTFFAPEIAEHSPYEGSNYTDLLYLPVVRKVIESAGYDGVVMDDTLENTEIPVWVAFTPEQIAIASHGPVARSPEYLRSVAERLAKPLSIAISKARRKGEDAMSLSSHIEKILVAIAVASGSLEVAPKSVLRAAFEAIGLRAPPRGPQGPAVG